MVTPPCSPLKASGPRADPVYECGMLQCPRQEPPPDHPERWADNMTAGNFTGDHFRESSQWKMLLREHAQLISDDTFVLKRFLFRCPVKSRRAAAVT